MLDIYPPHSTPEIPLNYFKSGQSYSFGKRRSLVDTTKEEEDFYQKLLKKDIEVIDKYISRISPKSIKDYVKLILNPSALNKIILAEEALEEKRSLEKLTNTIDDAVLHTSE